MEKPTLVCDFVGTYDVQPNNNEAISNVNNNGKPLLLRRASQSYPNLDVPHFLRNFDNNLNSSKIHCVLSGLFDSTSTLNQRREVSTEVLNKIPDIIEPMSESNLDRNKSALDLGTIGSSSSSCHLTQQSFSGGSATPLRKVSSSVANYSSSTEKSPSLLSFLGSNNQNQGSNYSIGPIQESQEDQGLVMQSWRSSSLASNVKPTFHTDTSATSASVTASPPRNPLGGVMGVFGRGFFAKPVIRSEEDNYRYIMALDR